MSGSRGAYIRPGATTLGLDAEDMRRWRKNNKTDSRTTSDRDEPETANQRRNRIRLLLRRASNRAEHVAEVADPGPEAGDPEAKAAEPEPKTSDGNVGEPSEEAKQQDQSPKRVTFEEPDKKVERQQPKKKATAMPTRLILDLRGIATEDIPVWTEKAREPQRPKKKAEPEQPLNKIDFKKLEPMSDWLWWEERSGRM